MLLRRETSSLFVVNPRLRHLSPTSRNSSVPVPSFHQWFLLADQVIARSLSVFVSQCRNRLASLSQRQACGQSAPPQPAPPSTRALRSHLAPGRPPASDRAPRRPSRTETASFDRVTCRA